jgi:hypothetical protein
MASLSSKRGRKTLTVEEIHDLYSSADKLRVFVNRMLRIF